MCYYGTSDDPKAEREDTKKGKAKKDIHTTRTIRVNRTESLDATHGEYLAGLVELPIDILTVDKGDYLAQMMAPTRLEVEKRPGLIVYEWQEKGKPDHYRHSDNYAKIAADMMTQTLVTVA